MSQFGRYEIRKKPSCIFAFSWAFSWKGTFFLCLHLPKVFIQLLYPVTVSVLVYQRCRLLTYVYWELKTAFVVWRPFSGGGVGEGSDIHYWLLIQYLLLDTSFIYIFFFLSFDLIKFFCRLRGGSRVGPLPNRQFPYVFFFLVHKRFQTEIDFNYKQPQVLGWRHLTHARKPIAYFSYH